MHATLIALLGPISGAHFNPAVSIVDAIRGELTVHQAIAYIIVQVGGCCLGALLAHAMFVLPLLQSSVHARTGMALWLAEFVATFGLLLVVLGHLRAEDAPWMVAGWIGAAITIARSLSNTFAGIAPPRMCPPLLAQLLGATAAISVRAFSLGRVA